MTSSLHERISAAIGDKYRIESEIGRGGMSVVYRAHDLRLRRAVAIKVLPPELAHDPAVRSRFTREAQTSARLTHPHIVPIFDVGEGDGIAYFVMALIDGGNLATRLEEHPLRSIDEVRRVLGEVADALSYAHRSGVIHRDIKADNILLDAQTECAVVTDFGIARAMEGGARLTQTGIAVGTPTYMSPEQAVGEREIDGRSDIYSLGVLGYQMLTGRVPFTAGNSMALLLKHVSEPPQPILELRPDVPAPLAEAVERALAKAPASRWPTAATFREAVLSDENTPQSRHSVVRERVRYTSPVPRAQGGIRTALSRRASSESGDTTLASSGAASSERLLEAHGAIQLEPPHLASLTPAQRDDLRLWDGRVPLLDRVKAMRRYALLTASLSVLSLIALIASPDAPPLALSPIVPILMGIRLKRRGRSLRESGLELRRVFLSLRSRSAIVDDSALRQLPRVTDSRPQENPPVSPQSAIVRRAASDRTAIAELLAAMPPEDRALLPEVGTTVDALYERIVSLADSLTRADVEVDRSELAALEARLAAIDATSATPDDERRISLLRHQRDRLQELAAHRELLDRQIENAGLTLGNLRLDLLKLRSSGLEAALHDVSTATQEARVLSKEIASALEIASEVRNL